MASQSLRDSLNSLGWSRRDADIPITTNTSTPLFSKLRSLNPFNNGGYFSLPTDECPGAPLPAPTRREEEEAWFALSQFNSLLVFGCLNAAALFIFSFCILFLSPLLLTKSRKFTILWTVASFFFLISWGFLMGFKPYFFHLTSGSRLPFTAAYFGSIGATLFFAIVKKNTLLALLSAAIQLVALAWYLVSYFPMGTTGLRFAAQAAGSGMTAWMRR